MKTKRPISINNSLVHGICNCNCLTCSVNKPSFRGPKAYQSSEVIKKIIERVKEACEEGIRIRYIDNSGDGEPTLHPEFEQRMGLFGELIREWDYHICPAPDVSVVTNGLNICDSLLEILVKNRISLKISFPTSNIIHYNEIMQPKSRETEETIFKKLITSIEHAMMLASQGKIPTLEFHISPPYREYVRPDFPGTIDFLTKLAKKNGLNKLELFLFPALANRVGFVRASYNAIIVDMYKDYIKTYHEKMLNGVRVFVFLSYKHFYKKSTDFIDVLRSFCYPCLWYAGNIFFSPFGDSCCCNDQNIQETNGNIFSHSIRELMELKEKKLPTKICKDCNQVPKKMLRFGFFRFYHILAEIKLHWKLSIVNNFDPQNKN